MCAIIGARQAGRDTPPTDLSVEEFFYDCTLVDEADDAHFARALRADKRICFVDLADKVRPALFYFLREEWRGDWTVI